MNIPLNIDWRQILLHLFNFSILTGGLYLLLFKPVKDFISRREESYRKQAADARSRDAALTAREHAMTAREDALTAELAQKRAAAQQDAARYAKERQEEARRQAAAILAGARSSAEEERAKILEEANREAVGIAETAMARLLNKEGSAIDQFLSGAEKGEPYENT